MVEIRINRVLVFPKMNKPWGFYGPKRNSDGSTYFWFFGIAINYKRSKITWTQQDSDNLKSKLNAAIKRDGL